MKFVYTEKKINVRDSVKEYAEKKIGKLDRLFKDESTAYVTFSVEKNSCIVELTVKTSGMFFRVSERTSDMFASIDSAVAAIERQVRKNKTRLEKRIKTGSLNDIIAEMTAEEAVVEDEYKVVRTKQVIVKPLTIEEAILEMNMVNHDFFMFRNAETNDINVVYKRKDGNYGVLEPS